MLTGSQLKRAGEAALGVNGAVTEDAFWVVLVEGIPEAAYAALTTGERDAIVAAIESVGETPVVVDVQKEQRPDKPIGRVTITVEEEGKPPVTYEAGGGPGSPNGKTDALFFSPAAVEKFVLPYYTAQYGPGAAAALLARYLDGPRATSIHLPDSTILPPGSRHQAVSEAIANSLG